MYITVKKNKGFCLINLDKVTFIEPDRNDANQTIIHFTADLYVRTTTPYESIQTKLALNGGMND